MTDKPNTADFRHLGIDAVRQYLTAGVSASLRVDGEPVGYLLIDPANNRLSVQLPVDGPVPDSARYENVEATRVRRDESDWNQFSVAAENRPEDLYPLLCQVLDRVQLEGQAFSAAVLGVLRISRNILTPRSGMSESDQIGLYGEVLMLRHLATTAGPDSAMSRWLGPSREEHDFVFEGFDLEVKTTSGERRRHWISSATQLTPTSGKELVLVSIQITGGGDRGKTLPTLVQEVADLLDHQAEEFLALLERGGYREDQVDLYREPWTPRTRPAAFLVDSRFPALRIDPLRQLVPDISRIVELRYQIDLTGLPRTQLAELDGFTAPDKKTRA